MDFLFPLPPMEQIRRKFHSRSLITWQDRRGRFEFQNILPKHFINAFGEELIVDNAEKGLAKACAETGAQVSEYTAAPVFMDENAKCRHQWLIEFAKMR